MTLIKKRDVKDYFAARRRQGNQIHIVPATQPDSATVLEGESAKVESSPLEFKKDFVADHSASAKPLTVAADVKSPAGPQAPATPGKVRK